MFVLDKMYLDKAKLKTFIKISETEVESNIIMKGGGGRFY